MEKKDIIDVEKITFDENGEASGLDEDVLNSISAGRILDGGLNGYCPVENNNC